MQIQGLIIGLLSFLIIGVFHPIVIRAEYHFGSRIWPVFLAAGLLLAALSTQVEDLLLSALLAMTGFASLWSIGELKEQEQRVRRGWFPANPRHSRPEDAVHREPQQEQ